MTNKPGQGRKAALYGPTVLKRIPIGCLADVIIVISRYKAMMVKK